jgi:hypothetical protein
VRFDSCIALVLRAPHLHACMLHLHVYKHARPQVRVVSHFMLPRHEQRRNSVSTQLVPHLYVQHNAPGSAVHSQSGGWAVPVLSAAAVRRALRMCSLHTSFIIATSHYYSIHFSFVFVALPRLSIAVCNAHTKIYHTMPTYYCLVAAVFTRELTYQLDSCCARSTVSSRTHKHVKRFAKRIDAPAFFVSAVANTGVHGSFRAIVDALIEKWPDGPPKAHRDAVKIGAPQDKPASRCCGT